MRRISCTAIGLFVFSIASFANTQEIRATVDGALVDFPDVQPIMLRQRVMVPVRGVFEHMNASVEWDSVAQCVYAQKGTTTIRLPMRSYTATVNGRQINLDAPATILNGRAMVPLRFLSESLGGTVDWVPSTWTVDIKSADGSNFQDPSPGAGMTRMSSGTVIPFTLDQNLSSNNSDVGDRFTGSIVTNGDADYLGIANGSTIEGHVDIARAKTGDTPGVLGLAFDRIRMADGRTFPVNGKLIGLDANSVASDNGKLTAKPKAKNDNLKYVGYGAGGGMLLAVLTKGNIVNNSLIGAALGFLYSEIQKDPSRSRDVNTAEGTKFGVRLTRDLSFRVAAVPAKTDKN